MVSLAVFQAVRLSKLLHWSWKSKGKPPDATLYSSGGAWLRGYLGLAAVKTSLILNEAFFLGGGIGASTLRQAMSHSFFHSTGNWVAMAMPATTATALARIGFFFKISNVSSCVCWKKFRKYSPNYEKQQTMEKVKNELKHSQIVFRHNLFLLCLLVLAGYNQDTRCQRWLVQWKTHLHNHYIKSISTIDKLSK